MAEVALRGNVDDCSFDAEVDIERSLNDSIVDIAVNEVDTERSLNDSIVDIAVNALEEIDPIGHCPFVDVTLSKLVSKQPWNISTQLPSLSDTALDK